MDSFERKLLARRIEQVLETVLLVLSTLLIGGGTIAVCLLGAAIALG
jgi:hypothetical protein